MVGILQGSIDLVRDGQFVCQFQQGRDGACCDRTDSDLGTLVLQSAKEIFNPPEVGEHADTRLAILAEGFDDAVITAAVGVEGLERGHR